MGAERGRGMQREGCGEGCRERESGVQRWGERGVERETEEVVVVRNKTSLKHYVAELNDVVCRVERGRKEGSGIWNGQ